LKVPPCFFVNLCQFLKCAFLYYYCVLFILKMCKNAVIISLYILSLSLHKMIINIDFLGYTRYNVIRCIIPEISVKN